MAASAAAATVAAAGSIMSKQLDRIIETVVADREWEIREIACIDGDIGYIVSQAVNQMRSSYLRARRRGKEEIKPELAEKYEAELHEAESIVNERIRESYLQCCLKRNISRIEFPMLEHIISRELGKKKIRYIFENKMDENILTVRVVSNYFLDIPVTGENIGKAMGLINYFLQRPECAQEEIPGIRRRSSYGLERVWFTKSSTGDPQR